ncbi:protease modulator HflC [Desulforhopalus vacuolatus]|uniref:protease modulator HflC n=1 Tax=Desulforhopalus vacuolatus TaxID=40414 RepID=UPI00196445FB|nr:protease modulator HflC [Desulforhopalus vacuolatus]MBM9520319.1 protease modulator HflC [Desulforhopalus vacuolatus]
MKKYGPLALIGLILIAIAVFYDGFFILVEGRQAVITQFGAPVGEPVTEAGLHLKIPFIQKIALFEKKILIWDGDPNQIPTNDKTYIYLDVTARWRISDALKFLQAVNDEKRAQSLLSDIIDGTVRDYVSKNNLIEIIRSSDWSPETMSKSISGDALGVKPKLGRDELTRLIREAASQETVQYGIELIDVMIKRVNYIESVRQKVYARMISERKRIAAKKRSLGEGEKANILGKVQRTLQEITSSANKDAMTIRGKADAAASTIYANAYSLDPEFYSFQKTLESYSKIVGKNSTMILSSDSELYKYIQSVSGK